MVGTGWNSEVDATLMMPPRRRVTRQEGAGEGDQREAVELDVAVDRAGVFVDETAVRSDASVVDQQFDGDAVRFQVAYQLRRTDRLDEVGGMDAHRQSVVAPPQVAGQVLEALAVTRDEHQLRTTVGELAGELFADVAAGSGHEGSHASFNPCVVGSHGHSCLSR
jgi:hypothetical protein